MCAIINVKLCEKILVSICFKKADYIKIQNTKNSYTLLLAGDCIMTSFGKNTAFTLKLYELLHLQQWSELGLTGIEMQNGTNINLLVHFSLSLYIYFS